MLLILYPSCTYTVVVLLFCTEARIPGRQEEHCLTISLTEQMSIYEQACRGYDTVFGTSHPTTHACHLDYFEMLAFQKQDQKARPMKRQRSPNNTGLKAGANGSQDVQNSKRARSSREPV